MSKQFRRLFISYSMSINKQEERSGSLFQKNFKRKVVDSEDYFTCLVYYIHTQPSHHGFRHIDDRDHVWSSYGRILSEKTTRLLKKEALDWFGGKEHYRKFHEQAQNLKEIKHLLPSQATDSIFWKDGICPKSKFTACKLFPPCNTARL